MYGYSHILPLLYCTDVPKKGRKERSYPALFRNIGTVKQEAILCSFQRSILLLITNGIKYENYINFLGHKDKIHCEEFRAKFRRETEGKKKKPQFSVNRRQSIYTNTISKTEDTWGPG